jgi:GLPGLI family protein
MILELDIDEGKRTLVAEKITLAPNEKGAITKPKKGKKVSREEYEKIVEEKTKEMEEQMGGNGSFQIKIRN